MPSSIERDDRNVAAEAEHVADALSGVPAVEHGGDVVGGIANDRVAGLGGGGSELALGVDQVAGHGTKPKQPWPVRKPLASDGRSSRGASSDDAGTLLALAAARAVAFASEPFGRGIHVVCSSRRPRGRAHRAPRARGPSSSAPTSKSARRTRDGDRRRRRWRWGRSSTRDSSTAAGGPDALIIDVPTAGGDSVYTQDAPGTRGWRAGGREEPLCPAHEGQEARRLRQLRGLVSKAGGVWFEGGRQFHLVNSYGGTKTEKAFHDVLARGGVVGGSSAGASILGDFLVRGAPSNNNFIMDSPDYEKGFGFLRNVGIDQHVVARERLADLADSIMPKYPNLLAISEDEGTAWVVKGDTATIVGRNKAFVYGGKDATDPGKPFLTLHPGDTYNLRRAT